MSDTTLFYWIYALGEHDFVRALSIVLAYVGSGWALLFLVPAFASKTLRPDAARLLGALLTTALFVYLVKAMVGRVRPWQALHLPPPFHAPTDPSFPSGHAAGSATVAAYVVVALFMERRHTSPATWGLPIIALAIGLSRVVLGVHYPLDVAVGLLLGAIIGGLAAKRREEAR